MSSYSKKWEERIAKILKVIMENIDYPQLDSLPRSSKSKYLKQLNKIERKLSDSSLKIAVIGEFSCGKSTFLNALLREEDLIKSGNKPTTASVTFISHGNNDIIIEFKGSKPSLQYTEHVANVGFDNNLFKDFLKIYQVDDEIAKDVKRIILTLDRDILDNEAVILDTPGFNSGDQLHQQVIEDTLSEEADACVILFSAVNAGRKGDLDFISSFARHINSYFFVLNKADRADEEDQTDEVVDRLQKKLKSHFGLPKYPDVFPVTSKFDYQNPKDIHYPRFKAFEKRLLDFARTEKLFVIVNSIIEVLGNFLDDIVVHIRDKKLQIVKDKKKMDKIRIKEPEDFIKKQRDYSYEELRKEIGSTKKIVLDKIKKQKDDTKNKLYARLDVIVNFSDRSELKSIVQAELKYFAWCIKQIIEDFARKQIDALTQKVVKSFEDRFLGYYKQLERLDIQIKIESRSVFDEIPKNIFSKLERSISSNIKNVIDEADEGFLNRILKIFIPAWAIKKIKIKIREDLDKKMDEVSSKIENKTSKMFNEVQNKIKHEIIDPWVNEYSRNYVSVINDIISENQKKRDLIKKELSDLNDISKLFKKAKNDLESEQKNISDLQNITEKIKNCDPNIDFEEIDKLINLANSYNYMSNLEYICNSNKSSTIFPLYSYLIGYIGILDNREVGKHFCQFFSEMISQGDEKRILEAFKHLENLKCGELLKTYDKVNYDNTNLYVKLAFSNICSKHKRNDLSNLIYIKEIQNLLEKVEHTYNKINEKWELL